MPFAKRTHFGDKKCEEEESWYRLRTKEKKYLYTTTIMFKIKKTKTTNIGKNVKQLELSFIDGRI